MNDYILPHHLEGEKQRLEWMAQLLDPLHRRLGDAKPDLSEALSSHYHRFPGP